MRLSVRCIASPPKLDAHARVVAGAMSSDPDTARASAAEWNLERSYDSFAEMAHAEAEHNEGIDFVIVAHTESPPRTGCDRVP